MSQENFLPILFNVLFGFVVLNMVVNLVLLYVRRHKINKLLAVFWPTMLFFYVIQGMAQNNELNIALAYSFGVVSAIINAIIGFEAVGRKFPWKIYIYVALPLYPLTIWLAANDYSFTVFAMPFSALAAVAFLHAFLYLNIIDFKKTTRLQKILGIVLLAHSVHAINFALFRMDANAQLWGWFVSYALCDFLAILLPSISLEIFGLTENDRLQKLVDVRTAELGQSLKTNENLFKVLIHDIGNPLMVIKGNLFIAREGRDDSVSVLERIQKSTDTIEAILEQVKGLYKLKDAKKIPLSPVALEECFKEVAFIFEHSMANKNVTLTFDNQLPLGTRVLADQTTLTHSVLSNLISNGLKFTAPNSQIVVAARLKNNAVVLEVSDEGPGISKSVVEKVMKNHELVSTHGSLGETGHGLGLSIVKSFVDSYGGQFEIDSVHVNPALKDFGTNVRITLDRVPSDSAPSLQ